MQRRDCSATTSRKNTVESIDAHMPTIVLIPIGHGHLISKIVDGTLKFLNFDALETWNIRTATRDVQEISKTIVEQRNGRNIPVFRWPVVQDPFGGALKILIDR